MLSIASTALAAMLALWIALLFHELGHAAAAQAVGVRVWGIRLGVGPVIWRGTSGGRQIQIAALPFLGGVTLLDEDAGAIGYRDLAADRWWFEWGPEAWRASIISAAGGLSNVFGMLIFLMAWRVAGAAGIDPFARNVMVFGIVANIAGYLNLLPCSRSDGQHLLAHLYAARAGVRRLQPR
jgi:membrane-associated protease RseP (regulator of RpoE activity)